MSTELVLADPRYMASLPELARRYAGSKLVPRDFQGKPEEIEIIGHSLASIGHRLSPQLLSQCYCVFNSPGFGYQLQIMLAAQHGCDIVPLDEESDEKHGVVNATGKDGKWHRVEFTIEDAQRAGWAKRNANYQSIPKTMLLARAVTKAISLHCPEAKMMLPPADREAAQLIDAQAGDVEPETGELVSFRAAGGRLVDTFVGLGYSRDEAREHARWLWQVAGLQPGDSVARTRLDMLLALAGEAPSRNPTREDGADSPDGTGIPAPVEDGEAAQARSHDPGGADESGQEPSDAKVSGRRRGNSASAAAGPDTAPERVVDLMGALEASLARAKEHVVPEVVGPTPEAVHDDAPEAGNLFEYGPDEEPF